MENPRSGDPIGIFEGYSKTKPSYPPHVEREMVSKIKEMFTEAEVDRRSRDTTWEFNKYYLEGFQMIGRDQITGETLRVNVRPEDSKRLLSMENKLRPVGRALVGKLCRVIPSCDATPRSEDQDDLKAAVVKTSFLDYIYEKERLRVKYKRAQETLLYAGTAVYELCWDRLAGGLVSWCKTCYYQGQKADAGTPCPRCQAQFEMEFMDSQMKREAMAIEVGASSPPPQAEKKEASLLEPVREGDILIKKLDTREFFPEPGCCDHLKLRYAFVRPAIPVTQAREMFADDTIHAEDGIIVDRQLNYMAAMGNVKSTSTYLKDHVYHFACHEAPTAQYPKGRIVHIVNDRIKRITPNYYYEDLGRLPFYFNWFQRNDGELWGESFINQAWHIQRERNRGLTQIREWSELTVRPKLLKPQRTKLGVDEITTTPGEILEFNPFAGKPSYLEVPALPEFMYANLDRQDAAIREQASVTEEEMGRAAADSSGRYAAIADAQSSETVAPILVENNDEWAAMHKGILILGRKYYSRFRTWTVTGKDRIRTYSFDGISADDNYDVTISQIDSLSKNPALRRQEAREYLADGVFTDPSTGMPDFQLYMRVAGLKIPGVGPDVQGHEESYFSTLPERLDAGEPFTPRPWDDSRIAVKTLVGWLRGAGRSAPEPLQMQIGLIYMYYLSMMQPMPSDNKITGSPGVPMQQAPPAQVGMGPGAMPGSSPGPQQTKPQQQGSIAQDSANTIRQADQAGEKAIRGSQKHEG